MLQLAEPAAMAHTARSAQGQAIAGPEDERVYMHVRILSACMIACLHFSNSVLRFSNDRW